MKPMINYYFLQITPWLAQHLSKRLLNTFGPLDLVKT